MFLWNSVQFEAKVKGKKTELLDKKVEKDMYHTFADFVSRFVKRKSAYFERQKEMWWQRNIVGSTNKQQLIIQISFNV